MSDNTIIKSELEKFEAISEEWWDINGKFKPLHLLNDVRVPYIRDLLLSNFKLFKFISLYFFYLYLLWIKLYLIKQNQ